MPGRARAEDVAVVVVTYDSEAVVGACLEAIAGAFQGVGARPRVVVVDNASVDATAEVVRTALPSATFLGLGGNLG
jgi:GT2 family glycosyltransferase